MKTKLAIILSIVALILILVYGADILLPRYLGEELLHLDMKSRGLLIGTPAAILPIISFFLTRKEKSKTLGLLILSSGILIMSGSLAAATSVNQSISDLESFTQNILLFVPAVGLGMYIAILGVSKLN